MKHKHIQKGWVKIKKKLKKQKQEGDDVKYLYLLSSLVLLTAIVILVGHASRSFFVSEPEAGLVIDPNPEVEEEKSCDFQRKLDGVCVKSDRYVDPSLVAVMIENSRDAWPLSGLSEARVVYEAPVEGDIPRFMAIYFLEEEVKKTGPVRSARPYYLDWLGEYGDTMYMHVGGSPEALEKIKDLEIFNINEFYKSWYFWRSKDRGAPHNTYTSNKLWEKAFSDYEEFAEKENYEGWKFGQLEPCVIDEESEENNCVYNFTASFYSPTYDAGWEYDEEIGSYTRYQNKRKQLDSDGSEISADTVVIQFVKAVVVDEVGRKKMDTIGSGKAVVFRDGYQIEGTWEKASRKDRTKFYNEDGEIIEFKSGKIWVEVLSQNGELIIN